jgi:fluoride ion exporter CrcB/FEX
MERILGIYATKNMKAKCRKFLQYEGFVDGLASLTTLQYEGFAHLPHVDGLASLTTTVVLACCVCLAYGKAVMPTDTRCPVSDM